MWVYTNPFNKCEPLSTEFVASFLLSQKKKKRSRLTLEFLNECESGQFLEDLKAKM